jgi:hypothetical protein
VLVPLTASLYVPGTLLGFPDGDEGSEDEDEDEEDKDAADGSKKPRGGGAVLVDVGTGFFVRKSRADASKFYEARVAELDGNLRDLEGVLGSKSESLRIVEEGTSAISFFYFLLQCGFWSCRLTARQRCARGY